MDRISQWLGARPHRATVVNVLMLAAILALAGSGPLYAVVGGGAVLAAVLYFAARAVRRTVGPGAGNLYQLALTWIPGVLAAGLALVALRLIVTEPAGTLAHALGAALFAVELAMLALAGADLAPARTGRDGSTGAA